MRLLIIEDELPLLDTLSQILSKEGYLIDTASDGETGLDNALSDIYDLILLDIMLPKIDGLTILKTLREEKITTPIIMLTAKSQIEDKIKGLDTGADDYLPKPFNIQELLARIRANVRRKSDTFIPAMLTYGDLQFDKSHLTLYKQELNIKLTHKEGELLEFFIRNKQQVLSKDLLIEKVWGYDAEIDYNHVEVYISFLRKKFTYLHSQVTIQTLRNVGYTLKGEEYV
jgi:DNA-binding response OmpR family regulator